MTLWQSCLLSLATITWSFMSQTSAQQTIARVLIYSATRDFRHDSIPTAIEALKAQGPAFNIQFDNTEDQTWFTDDRLKQYDALLFLSNTGEVLDDSGKTAFQNYLDLGGNFIGIHSASDCLRNTTFFQKELGAAFDYHPALQNATVDVIGPSHPSTSMLPTEWHVQDEMYNFKSDPRSIGAVVIPDLGRLIKERLIPQASWFQVHGAGVQSNGTAGRSFYTSLGHLNETWQDELFMAHVMGGIQWALQSNTTAALNPNATSSVSGTLVPSASGSSSGVASSQSSGSSPQQSGTKGSWISPTYVFSYGALVLSSALFWTLLL
ncbi:hypothetical protein A0H81_07535 [Grifola frondosa]|uniref:ThuA-like domain-containing protein n=1 Tax=Grifola frondosa TaxID=5627 RepID=A0A1C7M8H2_GRIFR|nr:hypothetical protein A0H81_07535 [Grifola frondosa]